jgi:hypothetical protein
MSGNKYVLHANTITLLPLRVCACLYAHQQLETNESLTDVKHEVNFELDFNTGKSELTGLFKKVAIAFTHYSVRKQRCFNCRQYNC